MHYSVIDPNIPVRPTDFVVSIMRKSDGHNEEHAFLMVEGEDAFGGVIFKRYDLVRDHNSNKNAQEDLEGNLVKVKEEASNNKEKSLIKVRETGPVSAENAENTFKNILHHNEIYAISWSITKEQAKTLHEDILKDQQNPPDYQVSGNKSLIAKSKSKEGHSCFTWAREKLHNLNDERITLPEKYSDYVAAQTSRYIKANSEPNTKNCALI